MFAQPLRLTICRWLRPALLMVCAGCQILSVADVETPSEEPVIETADLEELLAAGQWEIDREWSVLKWTAAPIPRTNDISSVERTAWRFVIPPSTTLQMTGQTTASKTDPALEALRSKHASLLEQTDPRTPATFVPIAPDSRLHQQLSAVSRKSSVVGWHAALLLALTSADPSDAIQLHEHLTSQFVDSPSGQPSIPTTVSAAAMAAWCQALSKLTGDPESSFAPAGKLLEDHPLAEEVRAELFRGIARKIAPRQIPGLNDVMVREESTRKASPIHLAAVEACVIHAWHRQNESSVRTFETDRWPDGLSTCRFSEDITLRKFYGRWAVLAGHPDALAVLKSQRMDNDLGVRECAVTSLGLLDQETARHELLAVMAKGTDPERVAAIACLARHGMEDILRFVRDDSPKVRSAVAKEVGRVPSKSTALTLSDMLRDRHAEVQLAVLEACRQPAWKDAGRVPLLLQALRIGSLRTRMSALAQLREEWGQEPVFPLDGTAEARDLAVRSLAREHGVSAEVFTAFLQTGEPAAVIKSTAMPPDDIRRLVQEFVHSKTDSSSDGVVLEKLKSLEMPAVPVIEQELSRAAGPRVEQVYRDVLPRLHPGYAAVVALEQLDAAARRQAARDLRQLADRSSLSPNLLRRLSPRMTHEQDRQVWQDVLAAIQPDALPDAAQIALIALNSPWPDIRLLGCDYFDRHPQPEYAEWLLPRLQDADYQIRLVSIRILARCGNPVALDGYPQETDAAGLRQFLTGSDQQLRWEAVVAMSVLGDGQAAQELIRQTYDPQPRQREQAVQAIGQTGQTKLIEPLLRRSWTETDRGVQLALLKALDQLAPLGDRPRLAAESSISDKIREWARWWEQRPRSSAATASAPALPAGTPRGSLP